jgi:hypothetical protein
MDQKLRGMASILMGAVGTHWTHERAALLAVHRSGIAPVVFELMAKATDLIQRSMEFTHEIGGDRLRGCQAASEAVSRPPRSDWND